MPYAAVRRVANEDETVNSMIDLHPLRKLSRPREVVHQFTPNWFALNMGTGILFLMLAEFPIPVPGIEPLTRVLFWADIGFYVLFSILFVSWFAFFRHDAFRLLDHPVQSMFLGAIPMGLAPIINGAVDFYGHSHFAVHAAFDLWIVDAALSLIIGWLVPFYMFTRQEHAFERMTGVWLLPIVPAEVAAASAGTIGPHLPAQTEQFVVTIGYALWAISVPLAFGILAILFLRLALHKLPHRDMAVSTWLALGPIGTGSLGLLLLGNASTRAFAGTGLSPVFAMAQGIGLLGGLFLWGVGIWWLGMATLITLRYLKEGLPFNMGWWGFTFPLGVYTAATFALSSETHFAFFEWFGALLTVVLTFFWTVVTTRTLQGMWTGQLFVAPCLLSPETGLPMFDPQPVTLDDELRV